MSKKSFRVALVVVVATFVLLGGLGLYAWRQVKRYPITPHAGNGAEIAVAVDRGMSFPAIAARLEASGVIDRPRWFRLYAMHRGATTKVRVGEYSLKDNMTPEQVLDTLLAGVKDQTIQVTIPEGIHMLEVFAIFDAAGIAKLEELEKLGRDPTFLREHGIDGETVDGYLFPSRYDFRVPTPAKQVLERLIEQHRRVWERVSKENAKSKEQQKKKLGWSERDFLIMASIVEKEAVAASERPRIAQVFINRLTSPSFKPHRLDTDPTIRYGCTIPLDKSDGCKKWDPTQRLRRAQLDDVDNRYNTYQHEGLPPGPICNPGEAAMAATMNPDGSGFFYFVSRNDGTHIFSRTRAEHERAVNTFQR